MNNKKAESDLTGKLWAVVLSDRVVKTNITYREAMAIVEKRTMQHSEIAIVTAQAAARFTQRKQVVKQ